MENIIKGIIATREVTIDSKKLNPARSQKIYNHSPDGFYWGYGGSGPAQLALAILLEFTDKDTAFRLHQGFKWDVIARLSNEEDFEIKIDVKKWIKTRG